MTLPVPTLDHVVINARDDMDRAADVYRRLGFTLTERGYHSLGSMNHLAMFGTDYLELIAIPKGATTGRMDLMTFPLGLNGLVLAIAPAAPGHHTTGELINDHHFIAAHDVVDIADEELLGLEGVVDVVRPGILRIEEIADTEHLLGPGEALIGERAATLLLVDLVVLVTLEEVGDAGIYFQ